MNYSVNMTCIAPFIAVAVAVAGCDATEIAPAPIEGETTYPEAWTHAMPTARGPVDLVEGATPDSAEGKRARRVTVDQLRRSIPALFGGITWELPTRAGPQDGLTVLSRTLGEADYVESTVNNTDPSPLFAKFMDDMAASVCQQAIERDVRGQDPTKLVIMHPDDVQQNMRFLRLKLHGIHVPEGSTEGIEDLIELHANIEGDTSDSNQAWWGVCIAMLTAPETMAY